VQLGKTVASDLRQKMAAKNDNPDYIFGDEDRHGKAYLEMLFRGKINPNAV
jgi:hypothetical protein